MSKIKNLTVNQLKDICAKNKYIAARYRDNSVIGLNCKVAFFKSLSNKPNIETAFYSFRAIDFQEYISIKAPFFTKQIN
jgi:hypothetical protein